MIKYDILICGIGGQGAISLGTILKLAAIRQGLTVVGAEKRGGAQREGIVTSNVRYRGIGEGEEFNEREMSASGLIPIAGADMMISMEPMEALRHARYLNGESVVIINDFPLDPVAVRMGEYSYPDRSSVFSGLRSFTPHVHVFDIDGLSKRNFNSLKQINTIALGLACALGRLPVSRDALLETIKNQFPGFEINRKAFFLGISTAEAAISSPNPA